MNIIDEQNYRNAKIRLDLIRLVADMEVWAKRLRSEQGVYERKQEFINASTMEGTAIGYELSVSRINDILNGEY